jgi:hypothetical protein
LEADVEYDVVLFFRTISNAAGNRNDGDKVDESRAVLSVINKICLALLVIGETFLHKGNCIWGGILSSFSLRNAAARCLEEAAVTTKYFMLIVSCKTIEGGGGIDDGTVVSPHVDYDERTRHVNGTEGDARIRSSSDAT